LEELKKLRDIEAKQRCIIEKLEKEGVAFQEEGDLIYQGYSSVEKIINTVKEARAKGFTWDEISGKLSGKEVDGVEIESISRDGFAFITVKKQHS